MTRISRDGARPIGAVTRGGYRAHYYRRHRNGTLTTPVTLQPRFTDTELAYVEAEAARRGMRRSGLMSLLIELVCRDKLIGAILDDGVGTDALPKNGHCPEKRQDDLAALARPGR